MAWGGGVGGWCGAGWRGVPPCFVLRVEGGEHAPRNAIVRVRETRVHARVEGAGPRDTRRFRRRSRRRGASRHFRRGSSSGGTGRRLLPFPPLPYPPPSPLAPLAAFTSSPPCSRSPLQPPPWPSLRCIIAATGACSVKSLGGGGGGACVPTVPSVALNSRQNSPSLAGPYRATTHARRASRRVCGATPEKRYAGGRGNVSYPPSCGFRSLCHMSQSFIVALVRLSVLGALEHIMLQQTTRFKCSGKIQPKRKRARLNPANRENKAGLSIQPIEKPNNSQHARICSELHAPTAMNPPTRASSSSLGVSLRGEPLVVCR